MATNVHRVALTELYYSADTRGSLRLYILDDQGYHSGGQWFARTIRYPDEEISFDAARAMAEAAIAQGREVRICNGPDFLCFHATNGEVVYPADPVQFWEGAGL